MRSSVEVGEIYEADNLEVLRRINDEFADLAYLDPPFNSGQNYNILFDERYDSRLPSRSRAFRDTWRWDEAASLAFEETVEKGGRAADAMCAFQALLGTSDMLAYLSMMAPRLQELHRVLRRTGSLYLHCDPTASHYLKVLMDVIFGPERFQREIIWRIGWVSGYKTMAKNWIRNHDTILFYTKSDDFVFNKEYIQYPEGYRRRDGQKPAGKGIPMEDTWNCQEADALNSIMIMSFSQEKMHYPTQKPEALLKRIIRASSNQGDTVLDPFCGCGTTLAVSEKLGRYWIGIDNSEVAVSASRRRIKHLRQGQAGLFREAP